MLNLTSLREQVYQYIREQMQTGALLPGSFINLTEMSNRLGISKTPLRDALIQLESEGFVKILARRGVQVNTLTDRDIRNFYEVTGILEAGVIAEVFDRLDDGHIRRLEELNQIQYQAVTSGDFDTYYNTNLAFHDVYLDLSDNDVLKGIVTPIKQRLYDFPRRSYIQEWELTNLEEHQQFIDCIRSGDREGASSVMRDIHWSFKVQEKQIRRFYSLVNREIESQQNQRAGR